MMLMHAEKREMMMVMGIIAYWCNVGGREEESAHLNVGRQQQKGKKEKKGKMKNGEILRNIKNSVSEL